MELTDLERQLIECYRLYQAWDQMKGKDDPLGISRTEMALFADGGVAFWEWGLTHQEQDEPYPGTENIQHLDELIEWFKEELKSE